MTDAPAPVYRGNLDRLVEKILAERGIDLGSYRRAYLERRIAARLRVLDLHSYRQYADRLDADPDEYHKLLDTLTINVTDFFRDKVVWDIVRRNVIPEMIEAKRRGRSRTIRCWSAGCATGQEPYSLAMALLDALGSSAGDFLINILATDLDQNALATAAQGRYEREALRHIPPSYQVRFTRAEPDGGFSIAPEVAKLVRWQNFSLFDDAPMRVVDVIFCRNVFIYFDRAQQDRVLDVFWNAMSRGGYLVLGRSEKLSPTAAARFEAVDGKERVYRKPAGP